MKKCFNKKKIIFFLKCIWKSIMVFFISIFYSPIFLWVRKENKNFSKDKKKVWVGISGGVDSSVSAILLKKKYNVVGVFIKVYQPEVTTFCWRDEMFDAKKICQQLKIPFVFLNLEKEYKKNIFDYMINSYKKGETPNPDVFCNKFIKFGAFLKIAKKKSADFIAMGHYARNFFNEERKKFELLKGVDKNKDQSYFLSSISQKQLSQALFPIGELQKKEVRRIAKENKLITAEKKDSQGLCFVGKVDMKVFLQNFLYKKKGFILNLEGEKIGEHQGSIFYTIGERHGFEIFPEFRTPETPRYFVLKKDFENNTITIGEKNKETENILNKKEIFIKNLNWISGKEPDFFEKFEGVIRYRGQLKEMTMRKKESGIMVSFFEKQSAVARGQILVIYQNNICIGEGEIF